MALVIAGEVAPMAAGVESDTFAGRVWLGDDGLVEAVTRVGQAPPSDSRGRRCSTSATR